MIYAFDFTVSVTHEQADGLMKFILLFAEVVGAEVGGGYALMEAEGKDDEQADVSQTDPKPE